MRLPSTPPTNVPIGMTPHTTNRFVGWAEQSQQAAESLDALAAELQSTTASYKV